MISHGVYEVVCHTGETFLRFWELFSTRVTRFEVGGNTNPHFVSFPFYAPFGHARGLRPRRVVSYALRASGAFAPVLHFFNKPISWWGCPQVV